MRGDLRKEFAQPVDNLVERLLDEPPGPAHRFRVLEETLEPRVVEIMPSLWRGRESPFVVLRLETEPPARELVVQTDARRICSPPEIRLARSSACVRLRHDEEKAAPRPRCAFGPYAAAVDLSDAFRDREAEAWAEVRGSLGLP
jgi:hypothetical protein